MSEVGTFTLNVLLFTRIIMQFVDKIFYLHISKLVTGNALIIMFVTNRQAAWSTFRACIMCVCVCVRVRVCVCVLCFKY